MYAYGATTEAFRESEVLWWVLLDDYLADFWKKNSPEGCMGSGLSTGSQQHFWLPEGLIVCELGNHGGLRGVMVGPVEGPCTVSKKNRTLLTPWRPPLWPGSRICPRRRIRFFNEPLAPPSYYFFWKPAKESSTGPTKTLRTPWRPTCGPGIYIVHFDYSPPLFWDSFFPPINKQGEFIAQKDVFLRPFPPF